LGLGVLADLILRPAEEPPLLHDFNKVRGIPWLRAVAYNDKSDYLYERPGKDAPKKFKWKKDRYERVAAQTTKGGQCEA
jgi:hypothetical protein